jgi:hypothetical protein
MAIRPDPFASALQTLRSAHQERRERRLTPVAPQPPRDSDPQCGEALPEHETSTPGVAFGFDDDAPVSVAASGPREARRS